MNMIRKYTFLIIIHITQALAQPSSPSLNLQINQAINAIYTSDQEQDNESIILEKNIGAIIFPSLFDPITNQYCPDFDQPTRLGFYFHKRNIFDHQEFVLVTLPDNDIILGLVIGYLNDDCMLETAEHPPRIPRNTPTKTYAVIIDKNRTWQLFHGTKLGKILTVPRRWIVNQFIKNKIH